MSTDKYDRLKDALIVDKNSESLSRFENLMIDIDKKDNDKFLKKYNKYDYMSLTVEEEEDKLSNIIDLIKKREEFYKKLENDYTSITGFTPDFLIPVLDLDKLEEYENRLSVINEFLAVKERIVNLSLNIKEYNKELKKNPDNKKIDTKLNKSTKKIFTLLNSLKRKENILVLLYEFCIIDTFHKDELDNGRMLKNILSSNIKRRKIDNKEEENKSELQDIEINKEDNEEMKSNIDEINDKVSKVLDVVDSKDIKEDNINNAASEELKNNLDEINNKISKVLDVVDNDSKSYDSSISNNDGDIVIPHPIDSTNISSNKYVDSGHNVDDYNFDNEEFVEEKPKPRRSNKNDIRTKVTTNGKGDVVVINLPKKIEVVNNNPIMAEMVDFMDCDNIDDNSYEVPKMIGNYDLSNMNNDESREEINEDNSSDLIEVINDEKNDTDLDDDYDYINDMIPNGMQILDNVGTVKPVSMMEKLENAQNNELELYLPSMGIMDTNNDIKIDSNDYLKNTPKIDKIS